MTTAAVGRGRDELSARTFDIRATGGWDNPMSDTVQLLHCS